MAKLKPSRHLPAEAVIQEKKIYSCNDKIILGTWNVTIMNKRKFNIVKGEMKEPQINFLGIKLRWAGIGYFQSKHHTVYYLDIKNKQTEKEWCCFYN